MQPAREGAAAQLLGGLGLLGNHLRERGDHGLEDLDILGRATGEMPMSPTKRSSPSALRGQLSGTSALQRTEKPWSEAWRSKS